MAVKLGGTLVPMGNYPAVNGEHVNVTVTVDGVESTMSLKDAITGGYLGSSGGGTSFAEVTEDEYIALGEDIVADTVYYLTDKHLIYLNGNSFGVSSGGDSGNAEDVLYSNTDHASWTNVKTALDGIIAKIYYVNPSVTSFTVTPSTTTYEKGNSVASLAFAWTYNKDISTQSLTDCEIELADRTAGYSTPLTSTKTFTLSASDGTSSASKSITISFMDKLYYGVASLAETYDSDYILALPSSKFASNYKGTYSFEAMTGGKKFVIAFPSSWGVLKTINVSGFDVEFTKATEIAFTNASGYESNYSIYYIPDSYSESGSGTI